MKDITTFINESQVPIFDTDSVINCDGITKSYQIGKLKIDDHAESYEEALTMIERDTEDEDFLYFVRWVAHNKRWECATQTHYWTKKGASGNVILVSSSGDEMTKEKLKKQFSWGDYVLCAVKRK